MSDKTNPAAIEAMLMQHGPEGKAAQAAKASQARIYGEQGLTVVGDADGHADQAPTIYPHPSDPLEVVDHLIKDVFTEKNRPILRWWRNAFRMYTGTHWAEVTELQVKKLIWHRLRNVSVTKTDGSVAPWKPNKYRVGGLMEPLQIETMMPDNIAAPMWVSRNNEPAPDTFAVSNGILNFKTRQWQPHTADYFNTYALDFPYLPAATAPKWEKYLGEVFAHDPAGRDALQEWFGYVLSGDIKHQKMLMFIGKPGAGKSVAMDILQSLVGQSNVVAAGLDRLGTRFDMAQWEDKKLAIMGDARNGKRGYIEGEAVSTILQATGNDPINIERKGIDPYTIPHNTARLVITANLEPTIRDESDATKRRVLGIRLERSFADDPNEDLAEELKEELPGILNWALDGYARLEANGKFTVPESQVSINDTMAKAGKPVTTFFEETFTITGRDSDRVLLDEVYRSYSDWCGDFGYNRMNKGNFETEIDGSSLDKRGVKRSRLSSGTDSTGKERSRTWYVLGVRFQKPF